MLIKNNNRPELVPGEILRPNVTIFALRPYGTVVDAMRICDRQKQQWFFWQGSCRTQNQRGTLLNKRAHPGCGPVGIVSESVNGCLAADACGQRVKD